MRKTTLLLLLPLLLCFCSKKNIQTPQTIIKHITVYGNDNDYCAWPSIAKTENGDILVGFCKTEEHLGPDGAIVYMRSKDNGETWQGPEVLFNSIIDDREIGFTVSKNHALIAHIWSTHFTPEYYDKLSENSYQSQIIERWKKHVQTSAYKNAQNLQGRTMAVSTDNGMTWKAGEQKGADSIHGGIELQNGTFLVASYRQEKGKIALYSAKDYNADWEKIAEVVCPSSDTLSFGEPHVLQLSTGRIIMMIRTTEKQPYNDQGADNFLWETYSDDNGKTWIDVYKTSIWGFPPHLLQLSDGRVLCTYGYRRAPFGQRACISNDGITWNVKNEIILRDDAYNGDLGYPASLEVEPGKILTIYYQPRQEEKAPEMHPPDPNRAKPDILGTFWNVPEKI